MAPGKEKRKSHAAFDRSMNPKLVFYKLLS